MIPGPVMRLLVFLLSSDTMTQTIFFHSEFSPLWAGADGVVGTVCAPLETIHAVGLALRRQTGRRGTLEALALRSVDSEPCLPASPPTFPGWRVSLRMRKQSKVSPGAGRLVVNSLRLGGAYAEVLKGRSTTLRYSFLRECDFLLSTCEM